MNEADCIVANGGIATHSAGHGCTALLSVVTIEARTTSKAIKHYLKLTSLPLAGRPRLVKPTPASRLRPQPTILNTS
jgi:hypothetical protein